MSDGRSVDNPFASRYVQPGAVEYLFPPGESPATMLSRWDACGRQGEIVGPHGSGKSTLVQALERRLAADGRQTLMVRLSLPRGPLPPALFHECAPADVVVIDGFEQLGWWERLRLKRARRRGGWGLIVTSHAATGLPRIATLAPDLVVARRVVAALLAARQAPIADADVEACFQAAGGNLREMLFALYDTYEQRRSPGG